MGVMNENFTIQNYRRLLISFQSAGYVFCGFNENYPSQFTILRHDVDVDPLCALQMAKVENDLNIHATYFFGLHSPLYNLIEKSTIQTVKEIHQLNHTIGTHIENYEDHQSVFYDLKIMSRYFPFSRTDIASIHRPGDLEKIDLSLECFKNVYQLVVNGKADYVSDSAGIWKYGHPLQRPSFLSKKPIQLLMHPVWWCINGNTAQEKIDNWMFSHTHYTKDAIRTTLPNV